MRQLFVAFGLVVTLATSACANPPDPTQLCSQPNVVEAMQQLTFNPYKLPDTPAARTARGVNEVLAAFRIIGGRSTDVANVYVCSARTVGTTVLTYALEVMSNGEIIVTDLN